MTKKANEPKILNVPIFNLLYIDDERASEGILKVNILGHETEEVTKLHELFNVEDQPIMELETIYSSIYKEMYRNVLNCITECVSKEDFQPKDDYYVKLTELNRNLHTLTYKSAISKMKELKIEIPEKWLDLKKLGLTYSTITIPNVFDIKAMKPLNDNLTPFVMDVWNYLYNIHNK